MTFQCRNCNTSFGGFTDKTFVFTCAKCSLKDKISHDWRDREPTDKQLRFIKDLGYTYKVPSTRGEASDIINSLKKRKIRIDSQLPVNDSFIQTAFVRVSFDEKELSLAQEKVNIYLSDGFRIDRIWEYGNDHWDTKGKVFVLTRGGTPDPNEPTEEREECVEAAFIRVSFDELTSEHHTSTSAMDLAQEKINIYISNGFEFWRTYPVVAEGQQIGKIVWLGKTQPATSEERMQ